MSFSDIATEGGILLLLKLLANRSNWGGDYDNSNDPLNKKKRNEYIKELINKINSRDFTGQLNGKNMADYLQLVSNITDLAGFKNPQNLGLSNMKTSQMAGPQSGEGETNLRKLLTTELISLLQNEDIPIDIKNSLADYLVQSSSQRVMGPNELLKLFYQKLKDAGVIEARNKHMQNLRKQLALNFNDSSELEKMNQEEELGVPPDSQSTNIEEEKLSRSKPRRNFLDTIDHFGE